MRRSRMSWIIGLTLFGLAYWQVRRRALERAAELSPTGMLRSPLYWIGSGLSVLLVGFVLLVGQIYRGAPIPAGLWIAIVAIFGVALMIRRALKWRYPV